MAVAVKECSGGGSVEKSGSSGDDMGGLSGKVKHQEIGATEGKNQTRSVSLISRARCDLQQ